MSIATSEVQTTEHTAVTPPRWRWYHAVTFYGVIQVLTLGLSGLVSLARGNRSQSLRSPLVLPDRRDLALEHGDMLWRRMLSESVCHVHLSPSPRLDKRPPLSGVIRWDSDKKG